MLMTSVTWRGVGNSNFKVKKWDLTETLRVENEGEQSLVGPAVPADEVPASGTVRHSRPYLLEYSGARNTPYELDQYFTFFAEIRPS